MKFIFENLLEGIQADFKSIYGEKLFTDFMLVRDKLKMPEKDMSYWMNKSPEELEDFLGQVEIKKSNSAVRQEEKQGAKLVSQTKDVKIYFVTTYEAMKYYGKGTKWCIAGNYPGHQGRGQEYFDSYIKDNGLDGGYYVLTDGKDKYCVLISDKKIHSIWDAEDNPIKVQNLPQEFIEALSASETIDNLEEFVIKNGILKGFNNIHNKTEVEVPSGVRGIGSRAFYGCTELTSVKIPSSVTRIGNYAFRDCTGLTTISIPGSVWGIDCYAFYGCTGLEKITIPNSVTSIGDWVFSHCTGLITISIPDSVTSIGSSAFYDCNGLTTISIPNSVRSIGWGAFEDCTKLTSITIPDSVTTIGNAAFRGCTELTSITIPNSVTSIGSYAFDGCIGLPNITVPNGVVSIGKYAFGACYELTSISLPNSVTSIGDDAFCYCKSLSSIALGDSVTSIGRFAFGGCENLSDVYYTGTKEQWDNIDIKSENDYLLNANIHFNSKNENYNRNNKIRKWVYSSK